MSRIFSERKQMGHGHGQEHQSAMHPQHCPADAAGAWAMQCIARQGRVAAAPQAPRLASDGLCLTWIKRPRGRAGCRQGGGGVLKLEGRGGGRAGPAQGQGGVEEGHGLEGQGGGLGRGGTRDAKLRAYVGESMRPHACIGLLVCVRVPACACLACRALQCPELHHAAIHGRIRSPAAVPADRRARFRPQCSRPTCIALPATGARPAPPPAPPPPYRRTASGRVFTRRCKMLW